MAAPLSSLLHNARDSVDRRPGTAKLCLNGYSLPQNGGRVSLVSCAIIQGNDKRASRRTLPLQRCRKQSTHVSGALVEDHTGPIVPAGTAAMQQLNSRLQEMPPTCSKDFDWSSSLISEPFNTRRDGCGFV
jgi:hypothetical protein